MALTQTQLDKKLNDGQGSRKIVTDAQGSGKGGGTATNYGGGKSTGDGPQGTGNADGISNDGAPCK